MAGPRITLVVAVAENGVIGRDGALPWRLSSDLRQFRARTLGKPVVMGRKTYESIGKPLDGRDNVVVTRQPAFTAAGVHVAATVADALALARRLATERGADEIAVIGGAEIFRAVLPLADRIVLTRVHGSPPGDVLFPPLDPARWRPVSRQDHAAGPKDDFAFTVEVLDRA